MLEKIKEEADVLYKDYSLLLKCLENSPESADFIEIEEKIKKYIIYLSTIEQLVYFPEDLIIAFMPNINSIEEFYKEINESLKYYKDSYNIYIKALPKTKTV